MLLQFGKRSFKLVLSPIESHNSLSIGERYHGPLRRIFRKIRYDHPDFAISLALSFSTKAVNDTTGPEGLIPSLLVFGIVPRLPIPGQELPNQPERMDALASALAEISRKWRK
jgi:hypothetical protein